MLLDVVVPPTYPPGCEVVICGEAGGREEVEQREGFVGKAGELLQKIIFASGLDWNKVGRTNVTKRPPEGGYDSEHFISTFYETYREGRKKVVQPTSELQAWWGVLYSELREANPKVVIACGNESLKALTGQEGISKYRGSILKSPHLPGVWVVPLLHPSYIQRSAQFQELYIASEIVKRKVIPLLRGGFSYSTWDEQLAPSIEDVLSWMQRVDSPFSLDIETRAGSIACVGLAYNDGKIDRALVVPVQTTRGPYFDDVHDEWSWWRGLQQLLDRQPVIGHNIFYDLDWLRDYGVLAHDVHDTMLLFHRMYAELPKGLDFVSMWFTDIPYYKSDGKTWGRHKPDEQLWHYNAQDVVATLRSWYCMDKLSQAAYQQHRKMYESYTRPLMRIAFEMQTLGLAADPSGVALAREVLLAELRKVRSKLESLSNGALVIHYGNKKITDRQVQDYLYNELRLPVKYNRKTKAPTADEDTLVELLLQFPGLEVLKAINAERKITKALNSYIDISWRGN